MFFSTELILRGIDQLGRDFLIFMLISLFENNQCSFRQILRVLINWEDIFFR